MYLLMNTFATWETAGGPSTTYALVHIDTAVIEAWGELMDEAEHLSEQYGKTISLCHGDSTPECYENPPASDIVDRLALAVGPGWCLLDGDPFAQSLDRHEPVRLDYRELRADPRGVSWWYSLMEARAEDCTTLLTRDDLATILAELHTAASQT